MARPATDVRQRILTAARQSFAARGVDATALRAIAKAADTTIGMIYYYYPSKDELYFAVVEEVYARVLEQLAAVMAPAVEPAPSFRERVGLLMRRLFELSADDRQVVAIVLRETTVSTARRQRLLERFSRGHIPLMLGAVSGAQAAGELRADLHPAMIGFATAALGAISTLLLEHAPIPGLPRGEARIEATLELLFAGIAAATPTAKARAKAAKARHRAK